MCVTGSNGGEKGVSDLGGFYRDSLVCQPFVIIVTGHTKSPGCSLKADRSLRVSSKLRLSYNFSYQTLLEICVTPLTAPKTFPSQPPSHTKRSMVFFLFRWAGLNYKKRNKKREELSMRSNESVKSPQPICVKGFPQFFGHLEGN